MVCVPHPPMLDVTAAAALEAAVIRFVRGPHTLPASSVHSNPWLSAVLLAVPALLGMPQAGE